MADPLDFISAALTRLETKLDTGLTRLEGKMDAKADKADLAQIEGEMRGLGTRVTALERVEDLRKARSEVHHERDERSWWKRTNKLKFLAGLVGTLSSLAIAAATCVSLLAH